MATTSIRAVPSMTSVYELIPEEEGANLPLGSNINSRRVRTRTSWRHLTPSPHVRFMIATACLFSILTLFYTIISRPEPDGLVIGKSQWRRINHSDQPRITIFQHFNLHNDRIHILQTLSRDQHERYASFWGYRYVSSSDQFVTEDNTTVRQRQMNKVYSLLGLVLDELGRENGAEWILITDADVLIVDPTVPLHALLPSDDNDPQTPLIVGSEDSNGFNSGNMLYRCDINLVAYLAHTIALSDTITKEYKSAMADAILLGIPPPEMETPPSDQRALCLVLQQNPSFSDRFFHYPQSWLNSYDIYETGEGKIQLHSHLVAGRKYRDEYDEWTEKWDENWGRLEEMGLEELIERVGEVRKLANEWWVNARVGLPKCIWI